jgi:hypothetical protein
MPEENQISKDIVGKAGEAFSSKGQATQDTRETKETGKKVPVIEKFGARVRSFFSKTKFKKPAVDISPKIKLPSADFKKWAGLGAKLISILVSLLLFFYLVNYAKRFFGEKIGDQVAQETPTPMTHEVYKPSVYAEDSEVLEVEGKVNDLEGELDRTDLKESSLNPPSLNFDVVFEEE